ncbi:MAG: radical SAM protein [Candidatus Altiarchaeota archaeon]
MNESPEYVRLSWAAAMTLGFEPGRFYRDAKLYCINLLLTYNDGCKGSCSYCGLAANRREEFKSSVDSQSFIRVGWPTYPIEEVASRIPKVSHAERVCVSMVTHPRAYKDTLTVLETVSSKSNILLSALITPTLVSKRIQFEELRDAGVDWIGIATDTATNGLFDKLRGAGVNGPHRWENYWEAIENATRAFEGVSVHLVAGLGETEKEMVGAIQKARDLGGDPHLFSFYPEEGSAMESHPQFPNSAYKRLQLARYLIVNDLVRSDQLGFDGGERILDFGVEGGIIDDAINSGTPFTTNGCPGKNGEVACNRPYSNCTPRQAAAGELRNYPFHPTVEDIQNIKQELKTY